MITTAGLFSEHFAEVEHLECYKGVDLTRPLTLQKFLDFILRLRKQLCPIKTKSLQTPVIAGERRGSLVED